MKGTEHRQKMVESRRAASALTLIAAFFVACQVPALAQYADPMPPPVGSGSVAPAVEAGDPGSPGAVPSGSADPTSGTSFPAGIGRDRTTVHLMHNDGRGTREAGTIRPDQLSSDQLNQIQGILGVNLNSGEANVTANVSNAQLEQINNIMAPYPQAQNSGGKKVINSDSPAASYPKPNHNSLYGLTPDHPLPTVWTFSRYLVILGVVSATIFMSMAAWSMVMGNPYGASRVIGAAAGMMLLLSAYTIWKIVQMNTYNANSDTPAVSQNRPTDAQVQDAFVSRPNTPSTPFAAPAAPPRSGVPVQPLGSANNP